MNSSQPLISLFETTLFRRLIAKFVDLTIIFGLTVLFSMYFSFLGVFIGAFVVLAIDWIGSGAGLAKRMFGLRVMVVSLGEEKLHPAPISFRHSAMRNLPFALLLILHFVPLIGMGLAFVVGFPYLIFEVYLLFSVHGARRLGDVMGQTFVVDMNIGNSGVPQ